MEKGESTKKGIARDTKPYYTKVGWQPNQANEYKSKKILSSRKFAFSLLNYYQQYIFINTFLQKFSKKS